MGALLLQLLPLLATAALTFGAWAGLRRYGGLKHRQYAVSVAVAVLVLGLSVGYDLPWYAAALGLVFAPKLFHRSVRGRLKTAASKIAELSLEDPATRLVLKRDEAGLHAAQWIEESFVGAAIDEPLILTLDFHGEIEEDYQVTVWGASKAFAPAHLVLHHPDASPLLNGLPAALKNLARIPGHQEWTVLGRPLDFALSVLSPRAAETLRRLFSLRTEERELYVEIEGGTIRLVSNRTFSQDELRRLLPAMAAWVELVRGVYAAYRDPGPD